MSSIVLSAGVRANLLQLQNTSKLASLAQSRLSSGKRVNSALDNPTNVFTAQGLSNRASDLSNLLDTMSTAISAIQAANNGLAAITKLVQSAQSIASQASQTSNVAVRAALAAQFGAIRTQIDRLQADAGFNGVNLIGGDDLIVTFDDTASSTVTITGVTNDSAGLAIAAAANAWLASADITAAADDLTAALSTLRDHAKTFGSNLSTVQIRQDFTKTMINTLQVGADTLTLADSNEEGANLLALQTRQQLSTTALSLAAQAEQNVLRLFQ